LTLQAARRIAQEESFGEAAVVCELNMAEILSRVQAQHQRIADEHNAEAAAAALEYDKLLREADEKRTQELEQAQKQARDALDLAKGRKA
jgi:hypothetical protein